MDYQEISIDDLETYYLDDPGGFLYVAITTKSYPSLHDVLSVFRKSYISTTTDEFNPLIEETQYNTFIREMESLKTEQKTNKDWYYLVYSPKLYVDYRSPQISQDKAQFAGNGASLVKNCNAGLGDLGASLRARRETAICCVVILEKGMPFPADDALHMTISRLAITCIQFRTVH